MAIATHLTPLVSAAPGVSHVCIIITCKTGLIKNATSKLLTSTGKRRDSSETNDASTTKLLLIFGIVQRSPHVNWGSSRQFVQTIPNNVVCYLLFPSYFQSRVLKRKKGVGREGRGGGLCE